MTAEQTAGVLLMAGSTVFGFGAAIGVPRVFAKPDAEWETLLDGWSCGGGA